MSLSVIRFYSVNAEYGWLSNFLRDYPVAIDGKVWPTVEHYYQAQKFKDRKTQKRIQRCQTPMQAARIGRTSQGIRRDWDSIRDDVMRRALRAKFTQHELLRQRLLDTGNATLIEHTNKDNYWADGGDGSGKNRLGHLLMELRSELRCD